MLYKFKSQAAGDVIMTSPVAARVLAAIGRDASERGIIQVVDMLAAISTLEQAMQTSREHAAQAAQADAAAQNDDSDNQEDDIPLHVRAQPFLDLLKLSLAEKKDIVWGV